MPASEGGLGPQLAGEKITVNSRTMSVVKQLGEGGFSFVYLVKDTSDNSSVSEGSGSTATRSGGAQHQQQSNQPAFMVLKITSIHSRQQRDVAEKEAKLLSRLSHPSIVRMIDACYRTAPSGHGGVMGKGSISGGAHSGSRPQHLILMEYCEGGTALSVCNTLTQNNQRFDLPSLIIAFGQICNAVSYLHAQRPPIVHRDLKPVNFLVKNGAYKLCDFGSAVFGHVDLRTPRARSEAEEVIEKTTTQMFRSPEMVDLYMTKKLTQATDVWALGCCLHSLAFFQNCFEEGSNLAILSRNYRIPDDNPYGDGIVELINRMLTVDTKARADMTEVILCLSAIYSGRQLPPRKQVKVKKVSEGEGNEPDSGRDRVGRFRTDGQGIVQPVVMGNKKPAEAKKLNQDSAAARRLRAAKRGSDSPVRKFSSELDSTPFTSEAENNPVPGLARSDAGQDAMKMKTFETSFSEYFGSDPFRHGDHVVSTGNESNVDPLSFSNFGEGGHDKPSVFHAFEGNGGSIESSFGEMGTFQAFDKSSSAQREKQKLGGSNSFDGDSEIAKQPQRAAINAKDLQTKGDCANYSEDDNSNGSKKKTLSGLKGMFKKSGKEKT